MIKSFIKSDAILLITISVFSFFINYYYAFLGVQPMDSFVLYNGGYRVLNGYIPFNDYWLITGPLMDYINAFFFLIGGVSWKTYVIHSSIFNCLVSLSFYILLRSLKLIRIWSLFYSILFSVLMYPVVGTPFVDHHSTIFLIFAFFIFIYCVYKDNYSYLIFLPLLLVLSFLSKQTPAVYGLFILSILIISNVLLNKRIFKNTFVPLIIGSFISLIFLFLFFYLSEINFVNFFNQYILFARTVGEDRINDYNFNLFNILEEYKFINIFIAILALVLFKMIKNKTKSQKDVFIIIIVLALAVLMIFHQAITFNQNYIFFLIPLLSALIHIFSLKAFKNKKSLIIVTILICIFAVGKYHLRFNEHRKFHELEKVDLSKSVDAKTIHKSLSGLKWITRHYPEDPMREIQGIKEAMEIIKKDKRKKTLITNYQFIAPSLSIYDYSPNQWHHRSVSFPIKGNKYHDDYKEFFLKNLKKNNIEIIYTIGPVIFDTLEYVFNKDCLKSEKVGDITYSHILDLKCKNF